MQTTKRALFIVLGSRGDLEPIIKVAQIVDQMGYDITIAVNKDMV